MTNAPRKPETRGKPQGRPVQHTPGHPLIDRALPHNLEAERALLGSILLDNGALLVALETITKDDFFSESHRLIFEEMRRLSDKNRTIDLVTLSDELTRVSHLGKVGGAAYIASLTDGVPVAVTPALTEYAQIIKDKSTVRRLINASNNVIARCLEGTDEPEELIDLATKQIFDIAGQKTQGTLTTIRETVKQEMGTIEAIFDCGKAATGLETGFDLIDDLTHGLHPGELVVLAARPSLGKTALALNIGVNVALRGKAVAMFSLEMTKLALIVRMLCSEARVDPWKLSTGSISPEDWSRLMLALEKLVEARLYIDDTSSMTVTQLRTRARRLKSDSGIDLLIVDYLQLVSGGRKFNNRNDEVTFISSQLKSLAKEAQVPVLVLSQLSREPERGRRRKPQLSDLRDSGSIEQDADTVLFLWEGSRENRNNEAPEVAVATIICGKQRNGPTGELKLTFLKRFTRFQDYTSREPEEEDSGLYNPDDD